MLAKLIKDLKQTREELETTDKEWRKKVNTIDQQLVPILPLEQILVAPVQGGGLHAIGRVPRSRFHVWWLRLAGVAFAALLLWAIMSRIA